MIRTMKRFGPATLVAAALAVADGPARAGLLAYEPFAYAPAGMPLLGDNGGTGFLDPWHPGGFNASIFTNYTAAAGSLTFSDLLTGGNHVGTAAQDAIAGLTRDLAAPLGAPGTTAYLSVVLRPEGTVGAGPLGGFLGLYLDASTTTPNVSHDLFLGKPGISDLYDIEDRGGTNRDFSTVAATAGTAALLVLRMDFAAGVDRFTLYVDPPRVPEPEPSPAAGLDDAHRRAAGHGGDRRHRDPRRPARSSTRTCPPMGHRASSARHTARAYSRLNPHIDRDPRDRESGRAGGFHQDLCYLT